MMRSWSARRRDRGASAGTGSAPAALPRPAGPIGVRGKLPIGDLLVQRLDVVDHRRDAERLQMRLERVAVGRLDRVLRPGRARALARRRGLDDVAKPFGIARRHLLPRHHLVFEDGELFDQDRRLQRVEARIQADMDVVVLRLALAVEGQRPELCRKRVVVGEHRAAVAVAAERLGRIEAGPGDRAERAALPAAQRAADRLRRILDDHQAFGLGDPLDRGIVGGKPEQVDRDDRLAASAVLRA